MATRQKKVHCVFEVSTVSGKFLQRFGRFSEASVFCSRRGGVVNRVCIFFGKAEKDIKLKTKEIKRCTGLRLAGARSKKRSRK